MAEYRLKKDDLKDTLLSKYISDELLAETDKFIESLATNFGVKEENIFMTFRLERLATLYVYIAACNLLAYTGKADKDGNDSFALKRKILKQEYDELYDRISVTDISGQGPTGAKNIVIQLGRA